MKKFYTAILSLVVVGLSLLSTPSVGAVDVLPQCKQNPSLSICTDKGNGATNPITGSGGVFTRVLTLLSALVGVAAVIVIIFSAIQMITKGDDANAVATARRSIIYALIGVAVAASAQIIINFVLLRTNLQ